MTGLTKTSEEAHGLDTGGNDEGEAACQTHKDR